MRVLDVRVDPQRAGAEVEHVDLAERFEVVNGLVDGLERHRRHRRPGPLVERLDRRVRVVAAAAGRKIICRCGVTRSPRSRNRSVSWSLVFMTRPPYRQRLSIANSGRMLPAGASVRGTGIAARLGRCSTSSAILENAARVDPAATAATLDDRSLTFGEIDERANRIANALTGDGIAPGRPGAVVGRHRPRSGAGVRGARQARRGVRTAQRPRSTLEEVTPVGGYARPRLLLAGRSHAGARSRARATHSTSRTWATSTRGPTARHPPRPLRAARRARPARHLLHEREHRPAQGRGALAPRQLAAHVRGRDVEPGRWRHRVHVPAVPHGRMDDRARRVAGRAARCTSYACPTRRRCSPPPSATAPRASYCIPAVWGRVLDHGVGAYDLSALVEADTGTSVTPPELLAAIKEALPHTVTRVFYGSTEAGPTLALADARPLRQAGQRRRRAAGCGGAAQRARRGVRRAARSSWTGTSTIPPRPARR